MKNFSTLLSFIVCATLISCGGGTNEVIVEIDNPSDRAFELFIDKEYMIAVHPNDNINRKIAPGNHTVEIVGQEGEQQINLVKSNSYMLNPSGANYIIEGVIYSSGNYGNLLSMTNGRVPHDTINIFGFPLSGNYKKIEGDFIVQRDWDYGLDEETPNTIDMEEGSMGTMLAKIHREKDFFAMLVKQAQEAAPEEGTESNMDTEASSAQ